MRRSSSVSRRSAALCLPLCLIVFLAFLIPTATSVRAITRRPVVVTLPHIFPRADYVALTQQRHDIGGDFATYYATHAGALWLGLALTTELPIDAGQEQIFQGGILSVEKDAGVITLPIVTTLISAGAEIPLAAGAAPMTYAGLASQHAPQQVIRAPWWWRADGDPATVGLFIPATTSVNFPTGHYIPALFAAYLMRLGDWQSLLGAPQSEAQLVTTVIDGAIHHITVQPFASVVLSFDRDAAGTAQVTVRPSGADYLSIYGPPVLSGTQGRDAWTVGNDIAMLPGPSVGTPIATFFTPTAVTLSGDSIWFGGTLWYHVVWSNLASQGSGWAKADQLSFTHPQVAATSITDLSALSLPLGTFAQSQGDMAAITIYVPDLNRYYVYNPDLPIVMGSTFKLAILLTLLRQAEAAGRLLSSDERAAAQAMIENSDNDAAITLYDAIDYNSGIDAMMASLGISGLTVDTDAFGYSSITPMAMTMLLDGIRTGRFLNADDQHYVLDLMSHIAADQQTGVGANTPAGATFAMKDGWIGDDSGWVTDSVGIVSGHDHTYIISVYVRGHADINAGWDIVNRFCHEVSVALLGQ